MPSKRFENLSEEKKESIKRAAIKEFCSYTLETVSINRIIKEAGISRGSFYTYFEDKRELMNYLIADIKEEEKELLKLAVKKAGGDFFKACDILLELYIKYFVERDIFRFAVKLLEQGAMIPLMDIENTEEIEKRQTSLAAWVWENIDRERLNIKNLNEFKSLMMLIQNIIMSAVFRFFLFKKNAGVESDVSGDYEEKMRVVKYGAIAGGR